MRNIEEKFNKQNKREILARWKGEKEKERNTTLIKNKLERIQEKKWDRKANKKRDRQKNIYKNKRETLGRWKGKKEKEKKKLKYKSEKKKWKKSEGENN